MLVLVAVGWVVFAQDAPLERLGSEDPRERDRAQSELLHQGRRVIPLLQQALTQTSDLEVADRLRKILDQLSRPTIQTVGDLPSAEAWAWSADGKILAAGTDSGASLYDASTGALVRTIKVSTSGTRALAFSPDETLLALQDYEQVRIVSLRTERVVRTIADASNIRHVCFLDNERFVYATDGGVHLASVQGSSNTITRLTYRFAAGGNFLALAESRYSVVDVRTNSIQAHLRPQETPAYAASTDRGMAFSPDAKWLVLEGWNGWIGLYRTGTWDMARAWCAESASVCFRFSRDSRHLIVGDARLRVWRGGDGEVVAQADTPGYVTDLVPSPADDRIVVISRDRARLVRLRFPD
jgi:WD40 repeat protein